VALRTPRQDHRSITTVTRDRHFILASERQAGRWRVKQKAAILLVDHRFLVKLDWGQLGFSRS
jgi:hypothetical protein